MPLSRPAPVYPPDAPVSDLRTAEHFMLCATRLWVARHCAPSAQVPDWKDGFRAAGIKARGLMAFESLFHIIATGAQRNLDVHCRKCPKLGSDEAWLLQAVSLLQGNRLAEARSILADWLSPTPRRMAMPPAKILADTLSGAGLEVPRRHCEAAWANPLTSFASTDHGLALLQ